MKRVRIYAYKVGLVFQNDNFVKVLQAGSHWLRLSDEVKIYDLTHYFALPCSLDILLQDDTMAKLLQIVEVRDHEIALEYRNDNFVRVLKPGRYAYWNSIVKYDFQVIDLNDLEVGKECSKKILKKSELQQYLRVYMVESFEQGLLFVDGKLERQLTPGVYHFWQNEKVTNVLKADLRMQQLELSGQEILTKDKAAVRVNFYAQYQVVDIEKALLATNSYTKQLYMMIQLALREYVGTMSLDEILSRKEVVDDFVLGLVNKPAKALGVAISACGIRDIILPGEVKEIMNQVLVAQKAAQANLITRREEIASTRSLLNTAKLMEDNEMLLKLKEMEYTEKIAEKISSITLSGGSKVVDQLRQIFVSDK